jgi:hypothetical protein
MIGPAISASGATQILVATKPVDFRKQADSLAALVQEALGADRKRANHPTSAGCQAFAAA